MTLAEFIARQRGPMTEKWLEQVRPLAPRPGLSREELEDSLQGFLTELERALRHLDDASIVSSLPDHSPVAEVHGGQRYRLGYATGAVAREYPLLQEIILQEAEDSGLRVRAQEGILLARCMGTAASQALAHFAFAHERSLRQEESRPLGARASVESRYRTLFDSIDDGFCIVQMIVDERGEPVDFRYLETNAAFEGQSGLKDVAGKRVRELVPDLDAVWFQRYGLVAATGEPVRFDSHAPALGRWFDVHASRVGPPEERQVAVLFKDITARKRLEAEREELLARTQQAQAEAEAERQKLREVFEQAPVLICIVEGPRHTFTFANPSFTRFFGGRDVVGKTLEEALPGIEAQGFDKLLDQVMATAIPYVGREVPMKHLPPAEGEVAYLNFVYQPLHDAEGRVRGVLACAYEVTEQVLARRQAEALSAQQEAILRSFPEPLYVADTTGITHTNEAGLRLLGVRTVEELPRDLATLHERMRMRRVDTGEPLPLEDNPLRRALQGHTEFLDFIVRDPGTGKDRVMRGAAAPVRVGEQVVGAVSISMDITERIGAERALRERADFEQKLIGIVGHDLRQPLQAIAVSAQVLLARTPLEERALRAVTRILSSAERAGRMLRDILDFTQARLGGGIPLTCEPADLAELARAAAEDAMVAGTAHENLQRVEVQVHGSGQGRWDADRLRQVLDNLLSNALTYGTPGVPVRLTVEGRGEDAVVLTVHNEGPPIPPELLPHLFAPMTRGIAPAGKRRSVGLGLFIVQHLVTAHGGTVEVASSPEAGTTFTLRLPRDGTPAA